MDWIIGTAAVLFGILMRLMIPIIITALIVLWLRGLDKRWQLDAEQATGLAVAGGPAVPCWEQKGCSPESRAACPVFGKYDVFCWQHYRDKDGQMKEECLACKVFKGAPVAVPA